MALGTLLLSFHLYTIRLCMKFNTFSVFINLSCCKYKTFVHSTRLYLGHRLKAHVSLKGSTSQLNSLKFAFRTFLMTPKQLTESAVNYVNELYTFFSAGNGSKISHKTAHRRKSFITQSKHMIF